MTRICAFLLAVSAVALAIAAMLSAVRPPDQGPVYSIPALRTSLERDPYAWGNRTVRVRAIATDCASWLVTPVMTCISPGRELIAPGPLGAADYLPLAVRPSPALLAALRSLPLLGPLVPPPQAVRWDWVSTYRIQLRSTPCSSGEPADCYEAVLLDVAPWPDGG